MTVHDFFGAIADFARAPAATYGVWRQRVAFRKRLATLVEEPHRATDLGFMVGAVRMEMLRPFWQPILLRRGNEPEREPASVTRPATVRLSRAVARHS